MRPCLSTRPPGLSGSGAGRNRLHHGSTLPGHRLAASGTCSESGRIVSACSVVVAELRKELADCLAVVDLAIAACYAKLGEVADISTLDRSQVSSATSISLDEPDWLSQAAVLFGQMEPQTSLQPHESIIRPEPNQPEPNLPKPDLSKLNQPKPNQYKPDKLSCQPMSQAILCEPPSRACPLPLPVRFVRRCRRRRGGRRQCRRAFG